MPRPAHFYGKPKVDKNNDGIDDKFVRKYNFKPEPVTGPYYIDKIKKKAKTLRLNTSVRIGGVMKINTINTVLMSKKN